ncbi:MAG: hypothetical protein ACU85E_15315 [Gammaproteobacteria bacterium]
MTDITFTTADYIEIRRRGVDLHSKIFGKLTKEDNKTCAKHLGVWQQKAILLESEEEVDLFADYVIYGYRPRGFNMAEKYLRLFSKQADDFELALLRHMRSARYAIYQIEETNGTDTLKAIDVFSKTPYLLVDHQLAKTAYSGLMLAGFLVHFDGFSTQTGGTVKVTRELMQADEVARVIDRIPDDHVADFFNNPVNGAKLAKAIVSATFRLGQADKFQHRAL